jgi:pyruvate kinase
MIDPLHSADKSVSQAMQIARTSGRVRPGERFIITGGVPVGESGTTNSITTAILQ